MSDPRADRQAYLQRVGARLGLPPASQVDVLDELEGHIAESTATLRDEGLSAELAEREALARLGDPGQLADGLRQARQTRRRLLLATGHGVWAAIGGAFWGYLFAFGIVLLSANLSATVVSFLIQQLGVTTSGWDAPSGILTIPYAAFASAYAGRRVPPAVSRRSERPVRAVAFPIAFVGGLALTILAIFTIRVPLDETMVIVLLLLPIGFVVGAMTVPDRADARGRVHIRGRGIVGLVLLSSLALTLFGAATMRTGPADAGTGIDPGIARVGPPASDLLGTTMLGWGGGWSGGVAAMHLSADSPAALSGWRGVRLEAWPAADASGRLQTSAVSPVVTAPMVAQDGSWSGKLELPVAKGRAWFAVFYTAVAPDGRRYVLAGPDGPMASRPWVGNVWEWFTTP